MKKILVAIDFSPASVEALNYAIKLGAQFDSHLLLLHVLHDPASTPGFYASKKAGKKVLQNMEAAAAEMLEAFTAKHLGKWENYEARIIPGLPAEQIVRQSRKEKVDLIVIGTRGQGRLQRLMVGSVADQVIRSCDRPVMVVHEPKKTTK